MSTLESNSYVDEVLNGLAIQQLNDPANFVAFQAAPIVMVDQETGKYNKFINFLRTEAATRAYGAAVQERLYRIERGSYDCNLYAVGVPVHNRRNRSQFDKFEKAALNALEDLKLQTESLMAGVVFNDSAWNTFVDGYANTEGGLPWTNASSTPVNDVKAAVRTMQTKCGRRPNVGVVSRALFDVLTEHSDIKSRFIYTAGGPVTNPQLAAVLGLEKVLVADAVVDSSTGTDALAGDFVVNEKGMVLMHVAMAPSMDTPSALYCFSHDARGTGQAINIRLVEDAPKDLVMVEAEAALDFEICSDELGVYLKNMIL